MARLIVAFANRYLEAYDRYRAGQQPTRSWQVAFAATREWWPIVLQHLLLSINAHINLDLGIAAARTNPGHELQAIKHDFDRINGLLADMIDGVSRNLAHIWPLLRLLDWVAGRTELPKPETPPGKWLKRWHPWKKPRNNPRSTDGIVILHS